jgi:spermidine dehydrogenase
MSEITRRDFINGMLMAAGGSMLPFAATSQAVMAALEPSYYPPARTGLRGSHAGSHENVHSLAWNEPSGWGPTTKLSDAISTGQCNTLLFD